MQKVSIKKVYFLNKYFVLFCLLTFLKFYSCYKSPKSYYIGLVIVFNNFIKCL